MMTRKRIASLLAAAAFTLVQLVATPAMAAPSSMQDQVDAVIAEYGGTQTGPNEITWEDGAVVMTLAPEGLSSRSIGSCATGAFCAFSGVSYGGTRLQFSTCPSSNSVASLGTVRSVANARSSGTVRAYDGSTLVTTLAPNTGRTSVALGIDTLSCS